MSRSLIPDTPVDLLQQSLQLHSLDAHDLAWRKFAEIYTPLLFRWAEDADELVQEVFALLMRELPRFAYDPGKRFRGWVRTLLRHKWSDMPAQKRRQPVPATEEELEALAVPDLVEEPSERELLAGPRMKKGGGTGWHSALRRPERPVQATASPGTSPPQSLSRPNG